MRIERRFCVFGIGVFFLYAGKGAASVSRRTAETRTKARQKEKGGRHAVR